MTGTVEAVSYSGPPPTVPPPDGWRPPVVFHPPAPRRLPAQDRSALDAAEHEARRVTWGIAAGAGFIALLIMCALLGRLLG